MSSSFHFKLCNLGCREDPYNLDQILGHQEEGTVFHLVTELPLHPGSKGRSQKTGLWKYWVFRTKEYIISSNDWTSPASLARKFDEQGTVCKIKWSCIPGRECPLYHLSYDVNVLLNYSVMNSYAGCETQQGRQRLVFIPASFL